MNATMLKPLAGLTLALCAAFAHAEVITFDSLSTGQYLGTSYTTGGYTFSSDVPLTLLSSLNAFDADTNPGGNTLTTAIATDGITVKSATAGGVFDLASFSLADWVNQGPAVEQRHGPGIAGSVILSYTELVSGVSKDFSEVLTLDKTVGLQTFSLNLDNLTSFNLTSLTGFQLDNVNVSAVPEPASMTLLLAGMALVGTVARRRKI